MKKKSYLVGIDTYKKYKDSLSRLYGCKNDVRKITSVLINTYTFLGKYSRVNLDDSADKNSILGGLAWLIEGAESGDSLIFYYSGHGAQVDTLNESREVDHKDEVLCPWDFDSKDPNTFIRDKDLLDIFSNVPAGVNLEVIIDCCFSGGMDKDVSDGSTTRIRRLDLQTTAPPDSEVRKFLASSSTAFRDAVGSENLFILWAACSEDQKAKEQMFNLTHQGVFSYYFCKTIENKKGIIRNDLINGLRTQLKPFGQIPEVFVRNSTDSTGSIFS